MFGEMMDNIGRNVCEKLFHMQLQRAEAPAPAPPARRRRRSRRPADAARRRPRARKTIESGGGADAAGPARANGGGDGAERGQAGPPQRAQGRPQRSLPLRQRQEVQEVPRRRRHDVVALRGSLRAGRSALAGCQADVGDAGCQLTQAGDPGRDAAHAAAGRPARQVGDGFFLLGSDGTTVRWAALDADGTLGGEQALRRSRAGVTQRLLRRRRAPRRPATRSSLVTSRPTPPAATASWPSSPFPPTDSAPAAPARRRS